MRILYPTFPLQVFFVFFLSNCCASSNFAAVHLTQYSFVASLLPICTQRGTKGTVTQKIQAVHFEIVTYDVDLYVSLSSICISVFIGVEFLEQR
jgi:hypothetical protein